MREQAEKARKYETFKSELESIEISLLINDITNLNSEYEKLKVDADNLRKEIETIEAGNSKDDATVERKKLELMRLEQEINSGSATLLSITETISNLEAQKQVISERKKYEVDDVKLANNILALKESILELESNVKVLDSELETAIAQIG